MKSCILCLILGLFKIFIYVGLFKMCVCVFMNIAARGVQKTLSDLGTGFTGGCEPYNVGAGNHTPILWNN